LNVNFPGLAFPFLKLIIQIFMMWNMVLRRLPRKLTRKF